MAQLPRFTKRPQRVTPRSGQESVWDYPRPPVVQHRSERIVVRLGGRIMDPRLESFGAKVFSSESATIDGTRYHGTTEHNTLVHRKDGDGYGYLDQGTTALYEAALTTTGHGDRILPGARPVSPPAGFAGR